MEIKEVIVGQMCDRCGKAGFYWKEGYPPKSGDVVKAGMVFGHPDNFYDPKEGDGIRCQWCGFGVSGLKPEFTKVFNYDTGELIDKKGVGE